MSDLATIGADAAVQRPARKRPVGWAKGQSGNPAGKAPGLDFRSLVERSLGKGPLANVLMGVFRNLVAIAKDADHPLTVQASKLLLERLTTDPDAAAKAGASGATIIVLDTGGIRPPTVPTTRLAITASDVTTVAPDPVGPD